MKKLITIPDELVEPLLVKSAKEYKGNLHSLIIDVLGNSNWFKVEERLPERENKNGNLSSASKVVQVKSFHFSEPFSAYYNFNLSVWVQYPYLSGSEILGITEWRYFLK